MKNILIHGLGQNETSWYMVSANLKKRNIEVEQPNLYLMIKDIKMDYDTLFQEFANYCNSYHEKLNLCGLSLGGILSLDYAKKFPDKVNSIILIGTPYKIPKLLFKLQGVIFYLMPEKAFKKMGYMKKDFMSLVKSISNLDISFGFDIPISILLLFRVLNLLKSSATAKICDALTFFIPVIEVISSYDAFIIPSKPCNSHNIL